MEFSIYRIFLIKRPRRLFQTWPGGLGVYLEPAFNRGPAFIKEVFFFCHFIKLFYYHPTSEAQAKLVKTGRFFPSSFNLKNFAELPSHHSIQHAYHCM